MKLFVAWPVVAAVLTSATHHHHHHHVEKHHGLRGNGEQTGEVRTKPKSFRPDQIVGGQQSDVGEFPYYVDLNGCGGSLIAPNVVLTAAHCGSIYGKDVIVGAYERGNEAFDGAAGRKVANQAMHPGYDDSTLSNDFSLLLLDQPATTQFVSLNSNPATPSVGQDLTVLGLGLTEEDGSQADFLRDVVVPAVSTAQCNSPASYDGAIIDEVMFCAGVEAGGIDSCQGDSGGPIVLRNGNQHIQVGVVSWGYGCARAGLPGIYARVSSAMDWIKNVACGCWGATSDVCNGFVADSSFVCPAPPCEIISGWQDSYGDGCGWYEANDIEGCPNTGCYDDGTGVTAIQACCHCQSSTQDCAATATYNDDYYNNQNYAYGPGTGDEIIPGWADYYNDGCGWYEEYVEEGCPQSGCTTDSAGVVTAGEACAHCQGNTECNYDDDYSNNYNSTYGPSSFGPGTGDEIIPGWYDEAGDGCGWYEEYVSEGCPQSGCYASTEGVTAGEACTHCQGNTECNYDDDYSNNYDSMYGPGTGDEIIPGWHDNIGDGCGWYEEYDSEGCPQTGCYASTEGVTAGEACTHCQGNTECNYDDDYSNNYNSMYGPGTGDEIIPGWADYANDGCGWYEANVEEGCPYSGCATDAAGVVTAGEACAHCQGNTECATWEDIYGPGTGDEIVSGWSDEYGTGCAYYEDYEAEGCPLAGCSANNVTGVTAGEACTHCQGNTECLSYEDMYGPGSGDEIIPGWADYANDGCGWYEEFVDAGCPYSGCTTDSAGVVTAGEACTHCQGNTECSNQD